jgi:hypothetical protein
LSRWRSAGLPGKLRRSRTSQPIASMPCWKGKGSFQQSGFGRFRTYRDESKSKCRGKFDVARPAIPGALFLHVRLQAKRNALDALSSFGTGRTCTQATAQVLCVKRGVTTQTTTQSRLRQECQCPPLSRRLHLLRIRPDPYLVMLRSLTRLQRHCDPGTGDLAKLWSADYIEGTRHEA